MSTPPENPQTPESVQPAEQNAPLDPQSAVLSPPEAVLKSMTPPSFGEAITSELTGRTYTMGDQIGEGAFSVVFACADDWDNKLAAKVLKPTGPYETVKESAAAEMQKLFLLRHPNITYFFDAFEYRDTFYIIRERCGFSLAEFFDMNWFEGPYWIKPVARSLLQAVEFIHLNGVVHQDIHTGNVFALTARNEMNPEMSKGVQFRLADLGVAKLLDQIDGKNTRAQWMLPPEVLDQKEFGPLDHRVDIYHCGLLLLQLAYSKELRFTNDEILAGKPRQMALELEVPLSAALEKALRRHASKRTESAREFWRDLNSPGPAIMSTPDSPPLPFPDPPPSAPTPTEHQG